MNVCDVSSLNKNPLSFRSNARHVYKDGKLLYKNKTTFFRDDLDWEHLAKFLDKKYKNTDSVNVINSACSDGAEPFSLAVILMEKLQSAASKFFPILASDIDADIIDTARNKPCNISDTDLYMINKHTRGESYKYFTPAKSTDSAYSMAVIPNMTLKPHIDFEHEDIFKSLTRMPKQNNVILCRNFWIYLNEQYITKLIEFFKNNLDYTSSIIIGELEIGWGFDKLLKQAGFKKTVIQNVYEKTV